MIAVDACLPSVVVAPFLGPIPEAATSSFTWKRPRDLESQQGRETPQGTWRHDTRALTSRRRVAPRGACLWTANQFRRSGNRVHRLLADYARAARARKWIFHCRNTFSYWSFCLLCGAAGFCVFRSLKRTRSSSAPETIA
jgi:hypothetical protein